MLTILWDLGAFAFGLGTAWREHWQATDLVWSLWLSSLVVGYASMMWTLGRTAIAGAAAARAGVLTMSKTASGTVAIDVAGRPNAPAATPIPPAAAMAGLTAITLFLMGFFTVHFGLFHFVHSAFLSMFFPVDGDRGGFPGLHVYPTVVRRYWIFLPATFIAERAAFLRAVPATTAGFATAIAGIGPSLTAPYKNVVRMHLLIFVFFGTWMLHLDNIVVVAIVYAVYFFPWAAFSKRDSKAAIENAI